MNLRLYSSQALHAEILQELGRSIASGEIGEGLALPKENELQERFGASRQTVREAIKVLAAKGMVRARKRAGTFVQPRSSWNLLDPDVLHWHPAGTLPKTMLRDLFEIRYLIEPASAAYAAERGDPDHIARIGAAVEAMGRAGEDHGTFFEADMAFHLAMFAASHNQLIDRLSNIMMPLLEANFMIRPPIGPGGMHAGYEHHVAVYDAIVKRKPEKARKAMLKLLDRAAVEHFG